MDSSDGPLRDDQPQTDLELIEVDESVPIRFCCARCGSILGEEAVEPSDPQETASVTPAAAATTRIDPAQSTVAAFHAWQWELDQDLHDVRHLLEARRATSASNEDQWNVSEATATTAPVDTLGSLAAAAPPAPVSPPPKARGSFLTWLVLSLSFMAFAGGGALLGWSVLYNRGDLWNVGLLSALGGQAGLLLGLVMFLERLWREGRQTTTQISEVDQRLGHLQHSAAINQSQPPHHGAPPYHPSHPHVASPHLLVSDIRHQLDLLAQQVSDSRR